MLCTTRGKEILSQEPVQVSERCPTACWCRTMQTKTDSVAGSPSWELKTCKWHCKGDYWPIQHISPTSFAFQSWSGLMSCPIILQGIGPTGPYTLSGQTKTCPSPVNYLCRKGNTARHSHFPAENLSTPPFKQTLAKPASLVLG